MNDATATETTEHSFATSYVVPQDPDRVYAAVNDVRGWWTGDIEGETDRLGAEFSYRYEDVHYSLQRVAELVPGRRVVWTVLDARLSFADSTEWVGTSVVFEITPVDGGTELRFTHTGLVPQAECFDSCSNAWSGYVNGSLRALITG